MKRKLGSVIAGIALAGALAVGGAAAPASANTNLWLHCNVGYTAGVVVTKYNQVGGYAKAQTYYPNGYLNKTMYVYSGQTRTLVGSGQSMRIYIAGSGYTYRLACFAK